MKIGRKERNREINLKDINKMLAEFSTFLLGTMNHHLPVEQNDHVLVTIILTYYKL